MARRGASIGAAGGRSWPRSPRRCDMRDGILESFLEHQQDEATALAAASDLLELEPLGPRPARRYLVRFRCRGLVHRDGGVREAECFDLGVSFPDDFLRRVEVPQVL